MKKRFQQFLNDLPSKLSRITSSGKYIKEIDGLRFFAIAPVVVQHLSERLIKTGVNIEENYFSYLVSRGFIGVFIFFVISGFVLALPFASYHNHGGKKINLKFYFIRRLTRLEPPYIIIMTILFIAFIIYTASSFKETFPHYIASIFYLHNFIYNIYTPINPVAWTLEVEVQFYILAPLLTFLIFKFNNKLVRRTLLIISILLLLIMQNIFGWWHRPGSLMIIGHLHLFLVGFLLADMYLCNWDGIKINKLFMDIIALITFPIIIIIRSPLFIDQLIFTLCLFLFFYAAFNSSVFNKLVSRKWIMIIGGMCYTIYLIHLAFAELFVKLSKVLVIGNSYYLNLLIQLAIFLPLLFIISSIFFILIEKPCMDRKWPDKIKNFIIKKKLVKVKT